MDVDTWERVETIVDGALELPEADRAGYVDERCAGDAKLRGEVEALLVHTEASTDFLATPAVRIAAGLLVDEDELQQLGPKIGRYEVLSVLGAGGAGTVFLARDPDLERQVALKTLAPTYLPDGDWVRLLRREARAASALNHPNILTIYEIDESDGKHFIASEFVDGQTLRARLDSARLDLQEIVAIGRQIAAALCAAHEAGIVHRDIKPENVMVRRDGYVKVVDFGLATWTDRMTAEQVLTARGEAPPAEASGSGPLPILGSVSYMSPEQVRGEELDPRTDLYSLGVVLYEMVTGRRPFAGASAEQVTSAILFDTPPEPAMHRRELPVELAEIVTRAMAKDREERYRSADEMVAALDALAAPAASRPLPVVALDDGPGRSPSRRRAGWSVIGTLVVLAALLLAWRLLPSGADPRIGSVAVLPFSNVDSGPDTDYLTTGLADQLITDLSTLPDFKVMSLNAVSRYDPQQVDARQVGDELKVEGVVTGSVKRMGEEMTISAELVDARDGRRLWGRTYTHPTSELVACQRQIAGDLSHELEAGSVETPQEMPRHTESPAANQHYLRGRYYWNRRTNADLRMALEQFERATTEDPSYALAWAGIADCYGLLPNYGTVRTTGAVELARAAALRALELGPDLAEAHSSYGLVLKELEWSYEEAGESLRRALELNPSYATARQWYAETMVVLGDVDSALEEMLRARTFDPFSMIINAEVGWVLYHARRYEEALEALQRAHELGPEFARTHSFLSRVYIQLGRYEEALEATDEAIRLSHGFVLFRASRGHILALDGRADEARAVLAELERARTERYVPPFAIALVYVGLGETERALEWLERAYDERDSLLPNYLRDPLLDPLRGLPQFDDLMQRVGVAPAPK